MLPGIPDKFSNPEYPLSKDQNTKSSQFLPAPTVIKLSSIVISLNEIFITSLLRKLGKTTFDPSPRMQKLIFFVEVKFLIFFKSSRSKISIKNLAVESIFKRLFSFLLFLFVFDRLGIKHLH